MKNVIIAIIVLALVAAGAWYYVSGTAAPESSDFSDIEASLNVDLEDENAELDALEAEL